MTAILWLLLIAVFLGAGSFAIVRRGIEATAKVGEQSVERCETCALSSVPVGRAACLLCVGADQRLKRRLAELGLTPGVELRVLQNNGGPVLVAVRSSRLALGRDMARRLDVSLRDEQ